MFVITRRALAVAGAACLALTATASAGIAAPAAGAVTAAAQPAWHISSVLNMKSYDTLLTLTALSRHDAWTFGQSSKGHGTAAHWNGSTWSRSGFPGPFRPGSVSATSPGNVWAEGSECTGGPPGPDVTAADVARYNGHSWTTTRWNTTAYCRASVVTTGQGNGWLLGDDQAEHLTGKRWQKVSAKALGQVLAATAVSAHDIWTVGGNFNAEHLSRSKVFFTHYNGRTWHQVAMPAIKLPAHGYLYPYDIEAASAHSIWAVVTVEPAATHSYLLHFNGSKWRSIPRTWTYDPVPTGGLPGLSGTAVFDVYAMSRIPGTRSMLATGDVFYSTATGKNRQYSVIFRYGS
jgi:hypothetical protein